MLIALKFRLKVDATISGIRRPTHGPNIECRGAGGDDSASSEVAVRIMSRHAKLMPQIGHQQYRGGRGLWFHCSSHKVFLRLEEKIACVVIKA